LAAIAVILPPGHAIAEHTKMSASQPVRLKTLLGEPAAVLRRASSRRHELEIDAAR
jgi:hypothetical protein